MTRSLVLALLLTGPSALGADKDVALSAVVKRGLDHGFPGFIVAVQNGKKPVVTAAGGYSEVENKTLMNAGDRFHIASVTKIFTATAALMLVDQGKLRLDEKPLKILGAEVIGEIPHIEKITVGQLLDHTSGIYGFNNDPAYIDQWIGSKRIPGKVWSEKELIELVAQREPFGMPGDSARYGDTNYVLLRLVVEKRSGVSLRSFVQRNILQRLKLEDTGYYGLNEKDSIRPTVNGYLKRSKTLDSFVQLHKSFKPATESLVNTTAAVERLDGASGMVSTVRDLARFGRALYSGRLLKQESMEFLLNSTDKKIEVGQTRQGVIKTDRSEHGLFYVSSGDGPAGINAILAYHPESDTVVATFANIFGLFDEEEFVIKEVLPRLVNPNLE